MTSSESLVLDLLPETVTYTLEMTRCEYLHTTITVQPAAEPRIEFRGDGVWQWGLNVPPCSRAEYIRRAPWIRAHGSRICWAEWLHDGGLEGWHTCIFYAGDSFAVLPNHPDYEHVRRLVALANYPDREVIRWLNETSN